MEDLILAKLGKVIVMGSGGMVGSACVRKLEASGLANELIAVNRRLVDLTNPEATARFLVRERADWIIIAAAKVGGIHANNTYPADFIFQNLSIQLNVIDAAFRAGTKNIVFLGSSCIYPRDCPQPIMEEYLLSGPLEVTNEPYAIAKLAGIKMCDAYNRQFGTNYLSLLPTSLYGPGDNYDIENSHVVPALIRRFVEAKKKQASEVTIWGSGEVRREFLHVDDLANAILHLMCFDQKELKNTLEQYRCGHLNIGVGSDISIRDLAFKLKGLVGYSGELVFDPSKPEGTPRKLMDVTRMKNLGWEASIPLRDGLLDSVRAYESSLS